MDPDPLSHNYTPRAQAFNLIDYKDSLRKSIRYRPTVRRRPPTSALREHDDSIDVLDPTPPLRSSLSPGHHASDTNVLHVAFEDENPTSRSLTYIPTVRQKHLDLARNESIKDRPGARRGSLPLDNFPATVLAAERRRASAQLDHVPLVRSEDDINRTWTDKKSGAITSEQDFLAWIVEEIQQSAAGTGRPRHTSHFFSIVLGGNVRLVNKILRYLKKFRLKDELVWVLGTVPKDPSPPCSPCVRLLHIFMFVIWVFVFLISTPIFYTLHISAYMAHQSTRGRMSLAIKLPLVFAVMSEDPDMIQVFLEAGCPLDSQDSRGNNIYHYLADLSVDDPEKSVRCHLICCACVDNIADIKTLITEQTNNIGITALEAIAKYGSLHFLRCIMVDKSCIGSLRLSVSKDALWADLSNEVFDIKSGNRSAPDEAEDEASLNVWEFDISSYENGEIFGKQSYLLQLVASRSVESMSEIDIWGFTQSKLLDKWISSKMNWYIPFSVFSHIVYLLITVLLLVYVVNHGGDVDPNPLFRIFLQHDMAEIVKAGNAVVHFNQTESENATQWDNNCLGWDFYLEDHVMDIIDEGNIIVDNCSATALTKILGNCEKVDARYLITNTLNTTLRSNDNLLDYNPVRKALDIIILLHIFLDIVIRLGFLWKNYNFSSPYLSHGILPVMIRRFPGSYTEKQLSSLMYFFYSGFLYANYMWLYAIRRRNDKDDEYFELLYMSNRTIEHIGQHKSLAEALRAEMTTADEMAQITGNLVIVCLMLRFIHTIHALRLLPGIGFFVITTKKMAKHLLQFTIVFVIVSLAFATIFHFVMREVDCPAHKIEGFDTLLTSLFSTYQVALGYGEYNFTTSLNARIAYVAYTIISMLLLLNLIIAVMTTTAEELNQMPWKQALCCVEQWDEILGTEVGALTLWAPVHFVLCRLWRLCEVCRWGRRPVWENIKRTAKKTFEVTYLR